MRKLLLLCLLLIMLLPGQALAAKYLTAVYGDSADEALRVVAKDAKTFRVDFMRQGQPTGEYWVMDKNNRWFVDVSDPTAPEAVDLVELLKAAEIKPEDFADNSPITKTDRKITINGIEGLVWEVEDTFLGTKNDLVLTADKNAVLVTKGFMQFFNDFAVVTIFFGNGPASLVDNVNKAEKKEYGLLKYKGEELTFLDKAEYPKDFFQLPKNVKMAEIK